MALLPNTIIYGSTGNNSSPTELIAGVAIGVTSATSTGSSNFMSRAFTVKENAVEGVPGRRNLPVAASGAGHAFSTQVAVVGGNFAYDQVQFMIRGVATSINGSANNAIRFNGNEQHRGTTLVSNKSHGAKTATAMRAGYFNMLGISQQRTNWSTAPATANANYFLPTNNGSAATDQAVYVTYRSVPGELTYMYGGPNPTSVDYPAVSA